MTLGPRIGCAAAAAMLALLGACAEEETFCQDAPGHACTWAGQRDQTDGVGYDVDGLDRRDTRLYWTMDVAFPPDGTTWFIDWNNHLVRRVLADQTVETVIGSTDLFPGDGTGDMRESSMAGAPGLDVRLNHPTDMAVTATGELLLMSWHNHKLRTVNPETVEVKIKAGKGAGFAGDDGLMSGALFKLPKSIVSTRDQTIYIADQGNFRVRRISVDGYISTVVGSGVQGLPGDDAPTSSPLAARLCWEFNDNSQPSGGIAVSEDRVMYVSDTMCNRILKVDLEANTIEPFAGTGEAGFSGDGGDPLAAKLNGPRDIEIGPDGRIYFADTDNHVIRAIGPSGIETVAGQGGVAGIEPEDGMALDELQFRRPFGLEFDNNGFLYVSDTINSRIVKAVL